MGDGLVLAADVSVFGGGVSQAKWEAARDEHGLGLAVVGAWTGAEANRHAGATLAAAEAAGLHTAAYTVLNSRGAADSIGRAKAQCGDHWAALSFVALDIEVRGVTEQIVADAAKAVTDNGLRPIIYTSAWFWGGRLGNPGWAAHLPLWDSHYTGKAVLDWQPSQWYGGWHKRVGAQYKGTNGDLGFSSDLSAFDGEWLAAA